MTILDGEGAVGTWVKLPVPESIQILAHAGFDFVVIDQEHAPITDRIAYELISMASALSLMPLVRVGRLDQSAIARILDCGAAGVLIPHVDTAEDADLAVRSVRFPPRGVRGAGGTSRAGLWGTRPQPDYVDFGNSTALCIPQLESSLALQNIEAIARTDGVDALFIGVADLSMDMGSTPGDAVVVDAYLAALEVCHREGRPCGFAAGTVEGANAATAAGFDFVMVSSDTALLATQAISVRHHTS